MSHTQEPRPVEPCCASESPEEWAEIAYWEAERADTAEAKRDELLELLEWALTYVQGDHERYGAIASERKVLEAARAAIEKSST